MLISIGTIMHHSFEKCFKHYIDWKKSLSSGDFPWFPVPPWYIIHEIDGLSTKSHRDLPGVWMPCKNAVRGRSSHGWWLMLGGWTIVFVRGISLGLMGKINDGLMLLLWSNADFSSIIYGGSQATEIWDYGDYGDYGIYLINDAWLICGTGRLRPFWCSPFVVNP